MINNTIENTPIRTMFWKDEILQVLYWMRGEGLGSEVSCSDALPFLNTSKDNLQYHFEKLLTEGFLISHEKNFKTVYSLSDLGKKEGGNNFAEAFQGLQKAGHGECGPDCEFCYGTDGTKLDNCVHNCVSH